MTDAQAGERRAAAAAAAAASRLRIKRAHPALTTSDEARRAARTPRKRGGKSRQTAVHLLSELIQPPFFALWNRSPLPLSPLFSCLKGGGESFSAILFFSP